MRTPTLWILCLPGPHGCGLMLDADRASGTFWVRREDAVEWAKANAPGALVRAMKVALPMAGATAPNDGRIEVRG